MSGTVGELMACLATQEGTETAQVVIIVGGKVLSDVSIALQSLATDGKLFVVFMVKKKRKAATTTPATAPSSAPSTNSTPAAATAVSGIATAASSSGATATQSSGTKGHRILLLLRHGQCCHEGDGDETKRLTISGQRQADASAKYVTELFAANKLHPTRGMIHSTSLRARETAAAQSRHMPGLQVLPR
jgi:hypothetical protein